MILRKPPTNDKQLALFSAMLADVATRDARETMEVPFLSLTKAPRFEPIVFKRGDVQVTVTGGKPYGIANIWDWDLILWLLSQVRQAIDFGKPVSRRIRFHRSDFLKDARRGTGGEQYRRLRECIERLANTNVFTTIRPGPGRKSAKFTWIEAFDLDLDERGRMTTAEVVIPEWLFDAVCDKSKVLTLDRDFFLLRGGLERWLYRLVRKGAGRKPSGWKWRFRTLYEQCGTTRDYKYFARELRQLVARGELLGYELQVVGRRDGEKLWARPIRPDLGPEASELGAERVEAPRALVLQPETIERAKRVAPRHDVYALVEIWRTATSANGVELKNADAAFLSWCEVYASNHPA